MNQKYTYKSLGLIETSIVSRLTYEKINIVRAKELDQLFNLLPGDRKQIVFRLNKKTYYYLLNWEYTYFHLLKQGLKVQA